MKNLQSLHTHTLLSDGKLTHQQVLDTAAENGISVVAFTEHDVLPDEKTLEFLESQKDHPTKWVLGIEMTSGLPQEAGSGAENGPHVIGLFIDPRNKDLLEYCRKTKEDRERRIKMKIKKLRNLGFDLQESDVLREDNNASVGSPHLVAALKAKEFNLKLIEHYRQKMEKKAKYDPKWAYKYKIMMQQGEHQYPYALFLKGREAFIPIDAPYGYSTDLDQTVALIRNAGGIAVIAHYATVKQQISFELLEELLKTDRLDGMETIYGLWKYGTDEESDMVEEREKVKELVQKYNKIAAGGGDTHTLEDYINYGKLDWYSGESVGMVEKILATGKVDKKFSSLK